eukprot:TRINITY_DN15625_c0_g1_i1.p4 TRINITY_DN15625_c0_g1~~TRINITY_DN15625_c0_g1_i1.p4  ORF type:complete len:101 (-),score=12.73 TRINITY_DN15625_c0_g1_i1:785-1087(-)
MGAWCPMSMTSPLIMAAASLRRKATSPPTSAGRRMRPSALARSASATQSSRRPCHGPVMTACSPSVAIWSGATPLQRTPDPAYAPAMLRVKQSRAALEAE